MATADYGLLAGFKGIGGAMRDAQAEALKNQLVQAQIAKASQVGGGNVPAPLQLANEYQRRLEAGDTHGANLIMQFAKANPDKALALNPVTGAYEPLAGVVESMAEFEGAKAGAKQNAQNVSDLAYKPNIASGVENAQLNQKLLMEPQINTANEIAKSETGKAVADKASIPILNRMLTLNQQTIDSRNPNLVQPFTQAVDSKAATALDLLQQERLNLAAPLAKQLGVNPTDKDFQASLDRIFNVNSTKSSREAQIQNLLDQAQARQAGFADPNETLVDKSRSNFKAKKNANYKSKYGLD
jgi:hypothetical protein